MIDYEDDKNINSQVSKILLIIFGILLICYVFVKRHIPVESDFVKIEGRLIKDVTIRSGTKARYNYFSFKLKEDIYKKAEFKADQIYFLVSRQKIKSLLKKDSLVSFCILKDDFIDEYTVQDDDIYGPKKLNDCVLEPLSIETSNESIFSLQKYISYKTKEIDYIKIFIPFLGLILIVNGFYYKKLDKLYKEYEVFFTVVIILLSIIVIVYIKHFHYK